MLTSQIQTTHQQTTKTSLFNQEFMRSTRHRGRAYRNGRLFAQHTVVSCNIVNSMEVRLTHIETLAAFRGKGMSSECLNWLCELADAYQVQIVLCPVQLDTTGLDVLALTAWYQRHGFVRLGFDDEMIRYPKSVGQATEQPRQEASCAF